MFCLDLQIIEGKVNYNEYGCLADFIGDVTRIFENCRYFNQEGSNVAKSAQNLEQFLAKQILIVREKVATLDQWNIQYYFLSSWIVMGMIKRYEILIICKE